MTIVKFIYKILNLGISNTNSLLQVKRSKVLNLCSLISIITALFFLIFDFVNQQLTVLRFVVLTLEIVAFFSILYLQKIGYLFTSKILFLLICMMILFSHANFAFVGFYAEYQYLTLPLLALFFFDKKVIPYIILVISIVAFYLPNYLYSYYPEKYFGYLNVAFTFVGVFLIVQFFKNINIKNEFFLNQSNANLLEKNKLVELQKRLLERANSDLEKSKKNELRLLNLKTLRSQMNPHFIFNALNSIQDYIILNQKNLASEYLVKFADLIRNYLHFSEVGFISISDEMHNLNLYLELEKLRFEEQLDYVFLSNIVSDIDTIKIPTMLIQPYIENALQHGLLHKKTNRKLVISIKKTSDEIIECSIQDNGVGRKKSKEINKKRQNIYQPFALKATSERLDLLNYGLENKIGVEIIDLINNDEALGTKVILKIPIVKE